MQVLTAPISDLGDHGNVKVFLAGGITNCKTWQQDVIERLEKVPDLDYLTVYNPRRENFPIDDPNASYEQIKWEFDRLQIMDIFTMFFAGGDSDQPICLYELGRNLLTMFVKYPQEYVDRLVITCDSNYKRKQDVVIQTGLALGDGVGNPVFCSEDYDALISHHVDSIVKAYRRIIEKGF